MGKNGDRFTYARFNRPGPVDHISSRRGLLGRCAADAGEARFGFDYGLEVVAVQRALPFQVGTNFLDFVSDSDSWNRARF